MGFFSSLKHMDAVCQEKILIQMPGLMNIIVKSFSFCLFLFVLPSLACEALSRVPI